MINDTLLHPTDADLLAYLDGEIGIDDTPRIARHVEACEACRNAIDLFRTTSSGIEELLSHISSSGPRTGKVISRTRRTPRLAIVSKQSPQRSHARPSLRAAIIILGLGVATLTVTPVRGWVVDFFRAMASSGDSPNDSELAAPQGPSDPMPPVTSTSSVSFVPRAGEITIHLANLQAGGTLNVTAVGGTQATGRITARGTDDALLVTSAGFRVQNDGTSIASYVFGLPPSVSLFVVQIGNRVEYRGTRTQLANEGDLSVDLARRTR